jgi:hypothetical protein
VRGAGRSASACLLISACLLAGCGDGSNQPAFGRARGRRCRLSRTLRGSAGRSRNRRARGGLRRCRPVRDSVDARGLSARVVFRWVRAAALHLRARRSYVTKSTPRLVTLEPNRHAGFAVAKYRCDIGIAVHGHIDRCAAAGDDRRQAAHAAKRRVGVLPRRSWRSAVDPDNRVGISLVEASLQATLAAPPQ